jgi:hypothetical protein
MGILLGMVSRTRAARELLLLVVDGLVRLRVTGLALEPTVRAVDSESILGTATAVSDENEHGDSSQE